VIDDLEVLGALAHAMFECALRLFLDELGALAVGDVTSQAEHQLAIARNEDAQP
jgi:hypothetical protein